MSDNKAAYWCDKYHELAAQSSKEIERLNALVAMQDDALKFFEDTAICSADTKITQEVRSASSETVEAWKAKMLEPLQRQVAMLDEFVNHCLNAVDNLNDLPISDEWATKWANKASDMLEKHNWYRAEKATAEAYDRELTEPLKKRIAELEAKK